ncbi:MAG: hypothetical protein AB9888_15515 [Bacteroidales bacterium]
MACDGHRHKFLEFAKGLVGGRLDTAGLERRFQAIANQPISEATKGEDHQKTMRLFGLFKAAGITLPTHSKDGNPPPRLIHAYADMYDSLVNAGAVAALSKMASRPAPTTDITYTMNRQLFSQQAALAGYNKAEVEATIALLDARADAWASESGAAPELWYGKYMSAVLDTPPLEGAVPLYQQQGININDAPLTNEMFQNLARAVIRLGVDEVRRTVRLTPDKEERYAFMQAVSSIDPKIAYDAAQGLDRSLFFQNDMKMAKGAVQFLEDGRAIIHAIKGKADISTLAHEIGHVFRRQLTPKDNAVFVDYLKSTYGVDVKVGDNGHFVEDGKKRDVNGNVVETGGESTAVWAEERFARVFERYLVDGKAPVSGLAVVFSKFKIWFGSIYKRITGSQIDVAVTPQMRTMLDSLFVSNKDKPMANQSRLSAPSPG